MPVLTWRSAIRMEELLLIWPVGQRLSNFWRIYSPPNGAKWKTRSQRVRVHAGRLWLEMSLGALRVAECLSFASRPTVTVWDRQTEAVLVRQGGTSRGGTLVKPQCARAVLFFV
mmetsp:Transcript_45806/g.90223  ORF Transcript_45806/g.90223 Transcript_45806/m.90223 type:complete len:114 (+) Transcript_45806:182-523(+)